MRVKVLKLSRGRPVGEMSVINKISKAGNRTSPQHLSFAYTLQQCFGINIT